MKRCHTTSDKLKFNLFIVSYINKFFLLFYHFYESNIYFNFANSISSTIIGNSWRKISLWLHFTFELVLHSIDSHFFQLWNAFLKFYIHWIALEFQRIEWIENWMNWESNELRIEWIENWMNWELNELRIEWIENLMNWEFNFLTFDDKNNIDPNFYILL